MVNNAQALLVVVKTVRVKLVEHSLSCVPERRVPEVVTQRNCLCQVLVEPHRPRHSPRYLRDFKRVRQACPVMVTRRGEEYLRLVLQAPKRVAVQYPVPVPLELCPQVTRRAGLFTPLCLAAQTRILTQRVAFKCLCVFSWEHILTPLRFLFPMTIYAIKQQKTFIFHKGF